MNLEKTKRNNSDEISIRNLLLSVIAYLQFLLKNWFWLVLVVSLAVGYQYFQIKKVKTTYPAKIKLLINRQEFNKENKLLVNALSKVIENQQLLLNVLTKRISEDPQSNLLINEYLNTYFKFNPAGLDAGIPTNFQFERSELSAMTSTERKVLQKILQKFTTPMSDFSDGFIDLSGDFALGIITVNVATPSEGLSLLIIEKIYEEIEHSVIDKSVFADQNAFEHLQLKTDSLAIAYKKVYRDLNKYRDRRERLMKKDSSDIRSLNYLKKKVHRLEAEADVTKTAYLAALELLNVAQLDLDQHGLNVQVLEQSFAPITGYQPSAALAAAKAGVIAGFVLAFLFFVIYIFNRLRKELLSNHLKA